MSAFILGSIGAAVTVTVIVASFMFGIKIASVKPKKKDIKVVSGRMKSAETQKYMMNFLNYNGDKQED